ncbi:MAG: DUF4760 domain-containing protein [Bacteroidota bacterium]
MCITLSDIIQILILVTLVYTAYAAIKSLNETKKIHFNNLDWNKKNRSVDIMKEFRDFKNKMNSELQLNIYTNNVELELDEILNRIKKSKSYESSLNNYLNFYEGISIGILKGLYDEEIIKSSRKTTFIHTYNEFKNYILYRRKTNNSVAWRNFEILIKKWNN